MIKNKSLAFKLSLLVLSSCTLIFFIIFGYNYLFSRRIIAGDIRLNAENLTLAAVNRINIVLRSVEKVPDTLAYFLEHSSYTKDDLIELLRSVVEGNPEIYGSTIAFEPYSFEQGAFYFAPYLYKKGQGENQATSLTYLGGDDYRYFQLDWYAIPKKLNAAVWSEPYYDKGGGDILMSTYSAPFYKEEAGERKFLGIVTADVSLEWLRDIVSSIKIGKSGYGFLISSTGRIVTYPDKRYIMNQTLFGLADASRDKTLRAIAADMVAGKSGYVFIENSATGKKNWLAYRPLAASGWSLGVVFPQQELLADITALNRMVLALGVVGLFFLFAVIILISRSITKPLRILDRLTRDIAKGNLDFELSPVTSGDEVGRLASSFNYMKGALKEYIRDLTETTRAKERMESELNIAHDIQMGILPKELPSLGSGPSFDIYAALSPARAVGGDFYDFFFIDRGHLCFAVADVSDKGVPAALFMSMAKAMIRMAAKDTTSPAEILERVNKEVCRENDAAMFVTVFLAVLDIQTGQLYFSNAGHNPSFLIRRASRSAEALLQAKSLAVGLNPNTVFLQDQLCLADSDTIFAYTDGVTEAFDPDQAQFSQERLEAVLSGGSGQTAAALVHMVMEGVRSFCRGTAQSDDITVLALRYLPQGKGAAPIKPSEISLTLENRLDQIRLLQEAWMGLARKNNISDQTVQDVSLALEEIVSNIIYYAWPDKQKHKIDVRISLTENEVSARISDDGLPFNPLDHPAPDIEKPIAQRQKGGLGIFLARKVTDKIAYRRENNRNILSFLRCRSI